MNEQTDKAPVVDRLLTDKEAGAMLGNVSRTTIWKYVRNGILPPPVKLGGATRFPLSDIIAAIEAAKDRRAAA